DGDEFTRKRAGEDEPARGHQGAGPVRAFEPSLPFALSGEWIDGFQEAAMVRIGEDVLALHTIVRLAGLKILDRLDWIRFIRHSDVNRIHVSQARERTV